MSSTDDSAANFQNSDTSGNVYDFKDSRTSGVVVVTKTWEDSLSNDERPIPDVSISTEKPKKNPLGYTIIYHGNGLTFEDGSTENEIIVNSSGKIVSGQYKLPGNTAVTWYSDSQCTTKIETDNNGLPISGIFSDLNLYAKPKTFILKGFKPSNNYNNFYDLVPSTATSIIFTDEAMPTSAEPIDVDADGDGGVVAWMDGTTMKVSTQISGQKIIAPSNCSLMFSYLFNLSSINLSNLDTSNVTKMNSMFYHCRNIVKLNLTSLDTSNVTTMGEMFYNCRSIVNLDFSSLDTSKVIDMENIFYGCSGLTTVDLSSLNTSKLQKATGMFYGCKSLISLDLSMLDFQSISQISDVKDNEWDYGAMFQDCSSLKTLKLPRLTSKITNYSHLFYGCNNLTDLDLSLMDSSNVTDMSSMFYDCSGLKTLNLSLNTQNVAKMDSMFYGCSKLINLSLGDKFIFIGSDYDLPSGIWYSSDGTAYTSDGISCTIPSNKADTYTRK